MRKDLLANNEIYHIFTKSIADFRIFNKENEFERMFQIIKYYPIQNDLRFSYFIKSKLVEAVGFNKAFTIVSKDKEHLVQIIAYCLMPTHIHLILKQLTENGTSIFMGNILNSYTRYFNTVHKRKGPLWESKFKNILIKNDEQLFHLTRYIHLNPVTAYLVDRSEQWSHSSYKEYLLEENNPICRWDDVLNINPASYSKFVNNQTSYQRTLARIKKLIIE